MSTESGLMHPQCHTRIRPLSQSSTWKAYEIPIESGCRVVELLSTASECGIVSVRNTPHNDGNTSSGIGSTTKAWLVVITRDYSP